MDKRREDIVFSKKFKAGRRRTYFFDVRETRGGDKYATITESKRRDNGEGYERHKVFIYKEDLTRFRDNLNELIEEMRVMMPDYDFDEFARRAEERDRIYQEQLAAERQETTEQPETEQPKIEEPTEDTILEEDDLSW